MKNLDAEFCLFIILSHKLQILNLLKMPYSFFLISLTSLINHLVHACEFSSLLSCLVYDNQFMTDRSLLVFLFLIISILYSGTSITQNSRMRRICGFCSVQLSRDKNLYISKKNTSITRNSFSRSILPLLGLFFTCTTQIYLYNSNFISVTRTVEFLL